MCLLASFIVEVSCTRLSKAAISGIRQEKNFKLLSFCYLSTR